VDGAQARPRAVARPPGASAAALALAANQSIIREMRRARNGVALAAVACGLALGACGSGASGGGDADASGVTDAQGDAGADADADDFVDAAPVTLAAAVVTTIALPGVPTVAAYNAGTKKVYFGCQTPAKTSAGVAVVDDVTNTVVATIAVAAPLTSLVANGTTKKMYGVEGDQIDVIDSATDTITTKVATPDQTPIAGLAVDEAHDRVYVVASSGGTTSLYALDGALNTLAAPTPVLLSPEGAPPIAVDPVTQKVFVLGVDSNQEGLVVTFDGPSGIPLGLATTKSRVSASASAVMSLGDGTAAMLLVSPSVVGHLGHMDVSLPDPFTPTAVVELDFGAGPSVVVVGTLAGAPAQGYAVAPGNGALSPFSLDGDGAVFANEAAQQIIAAAPIAGGTELFVDLADLPATADASFDGGEGADTADGGDAGAVDAGGGVADGGVGDGGAALRSGPAETVKIALTIAK
jgi:hypothetical protein